MTPLRLSDLPPEAREQLGLSRTRGARKPPPEFVEPDPPTEREAEVKRIRRRLCIISAYLTPDPAQLRECAGAVREALEAIERLTEGKGD